RAAALFRRAVLSLLAAYSIADHSAARTAHAVNATIRRAAAITADYLIVGTALVRRRALSRGATGVAADHLIVGTALAQGRALSRGATGVAAAVLIARTALATALRRPPSVVADEVTPSVDADRGCMSRRGTSYATRPRA